VQRPDQASAQLLPELSLKKAKRAVTVMIKISDAFKIDRRRLLAVAISVAAAATLPRQASARHRPTRVLFICQFGSAKSAIARELLKRRAAQRGVPVSVTSRGITPELHLAPATREKLLAEGIRLDGEPIRKLQRDDFRRRDIVIIFNPLPENLRQNDVLDWSTTPSVNESWPSARANLDRQIDLLLDFIAR
jgi:hypothetical protein